MARKPAHVSLYVKSGGCRAHRRYGQRVQVEYRTGEPTFREDTNMCTLVVLWLAGIPVADKAVLHLAASLREADLIFTAERLERAYDREARIVALDIPDREAILRVLEDCPEELGELRATLLQEHVWRKREGLA